MKNKKNYFALRKIVCILICLSMMPWAVSLTSCNSAEDTQTREAPKQSEEQYALALRAIDDIDIGDAFDEDRIEIVRVRTDALPADTCSSIAELDGKYALSRICGGDFITAEKITDQKIDQTVDEEKNEVTEPEAVDPYALGYVVITKYLSFVEGEDCALAIQKAIEENPSRTIYFPDGNYMIKSPIIIPADPSKSVSLRLSNQAVITASEWGEDKTKAMIQIGCENENEAQSESANDGFDPLEERSISVMGGCLYGSGLASGIAVGGGKDTYIYNVSIKRVYNGIHIKHAENELGATCVDVDNVNITGMEAIGSAGVLVEGTYNNFSNMRIASTNYGVLCTKTGSNNTFRNIHPLVVGLNRENVHTVGFWDKSEGNVFDVCYSDQFSTGFLVEENTRSVFSGCFCFWYSERNDYHVGYGATGKFNSIISAGKVYHRQSVSFDAYLCIGAEGGQGVVLYPTNSINSHIDMLKQHCRTEIIVFIL